MSFHQIFEPMKKSTISRHFAWPVLLLLAGPLRAQQAQPNDPPAQQEVIERDPKAAAPGTYQFIVTPKGAREAILKDFLVTAEVLRRQHETVYYRISGDVTMMVVSQDELCRPDFRPLPEYVMRKEDD
jgi:hypothetical protein